MQLSAPIVTGGTVARGEADTSTTAFQNKNVYTGTSVLVGNIFFGITTRPMLKFTGHGIPGGAVIDSATLTLVPSVSRAATSHVNILALQATGVWDVDSFTGWRRPAWGTFKANIRDTSSTTIVNTVPGAANSFWGMQAETPVLRRQRLAVVFTPAANATLGEVLMNVRRSGTGSPSGTGSVFVEIHGTDANGNPDENVLATSGSLTAASMPFPAADRTFPFTGVNQIPLVAGTTYAVVFNATEGPDVSNNVQWMTLGAFFSIAGSRHYGQGRDFDNQNFPDQGSGILNPTLASPSVLWVMPAHTAGVATVSPDIASVIQAATNQPNYDPSRGIGLALAPAAPPNNARRDIAAFEHPIFAAASISVTYRTRLDRLVLRGAPDQRVALTGAVANRPALKGAPRSRISLAGETATRVSLRGAPATRQTLFGEED